MPQSVRADGLRGSVNLRRDAARAALLGVLALAALLYGALDKTVTLAVEGRASRVRTFALTVGDVLDRVGIRLGPGDWVSPPLAARLAEGAKIEIRRAKQITIVLNGQPRRVITTALTVEQVLADLGVRRGMRDYIAASRDGRLGTGQTIVYREAVAIAIRHDGKTDQVITNAPDVATVLEEIGLTLGARDRVQPPPATYPTSGLTVRVERVGDRIETEQREIDYPTLYENRLNMEYGTHKTVRSGKLGVRALRYRSTYVDGRRVTRTFLGSRVLRDPLPRVVAVGRGFPGCTCNRGVSRGEASWYHADGLTAAHRWLPFGTVVRVENVATGAWVNVVIRDRGPYANGRIIDLSDNAFSRLAPLSKGILTVRIRW